MRALLVNPWVYDFACYDLFSKPIGLLQIATLLKRSGFDISFIDCLDRFNPDLLNFTGRDSFKPSVYGSGNYHSEIVKKPDIFKKIPRHYKRYGIPPSLFRKLLDDINQPDIILVTSGMTYWYKGVLESIEILKQRFSRTPLILGGIYATLCHEHASKYSDADFVFKGGKLDTLLELISNLLNLKLSNSSVPGYLPPAYELYPELRYISLRTSTGCPFKCTYCGWYLMNPEFSQRSPDAVSGEIEHFYRKSGIKNFAFYDEALFYNPEKHIIEILKTILKKGVSANFHTPDGLHAKFLTKDLASLLRKSGFVQPRLGFESADLSRQIITGGKVNNMDLVKAVSYLKEAGYSSHEIGVYILIGMPDQPPQEIEESILFAHELKVRVFLEEYSPVPGTPDYERSGLSVDADPLLHNNSAFPLYNPERFSEFQKFKDLAHGLNKLI